MKTTPYIEWSIVLFLFLLAPYSCTKSVQETRLSHEDAQFSMVIASDASEFKDSIRERITHRYQDQGNMEIVNIKKLKDIDPTEYDVVLIIDTCLAWSGFNPSLNTFLEENEYKDNVVVFMTAGDPDWTYSYQGVDAITSASLMENEDVIVAEITHEIDQILELK